MQRCGSSLGALGAPLPLMTLLAVSACARTPPPGVLLPPLDHVIETPEPAPVDAAPLTHVLRGLYFIKGGRPGAAIPHLKLALVYAPKSAFLHEQLSRAWGASGDEEKARQALTQGLWAEPNDPWLNLLAAELDIYDRKYDAAAVRLRTAVRAGAEGQPLERLFARAAPLFVDVLLWTERRAEARTYAEALALRPQSSPELLGQVAGVLEDHDELEAARGLYRRARVLRPSDRGAAAGEARGLALAGDAAAAADALVPLFAHYPDDLSLYIEVTRLLRRAGSAESASYREAALTQTEGDPFGRSTVALGDLFEGHREEGLALLREAAAAVAAPTEVRIVLAETLLRHGDAQGCLRALGNGGADELARPRAFCVAALGQLDKAMAELVAAARSGVGLRDVLSDAARLIAPQVDEAEARRRLAVLLATLGLGAGEVEARLALAMLVDFYGHGDEAKSLVSDVAEKTPDDVDVAMRLADLRARYDELDSGRAMLERLVNEQPYDPVRLNALGFTLADANVALEEASVWLRRAYRLAPDEGFVIDSLGWLLYRQRRYRDALALLLLASRAAPGDPEILLHLGDVYSALGKRSAAEAAYQAALAAQPPPLLRKRIEAKRQAQP